MGRRRIVLVPVRRETLEAVARIIGEQSAAARALADADRYPGPVQFWRDGAWIVVEKLQAEQPTAPATGRASRTP